MDFQPPAFEPRPLETTAHMGVAPHDSPDESAAVVLDHRDGQSLVDAQIIGVEPADPRNPPPAHQRYVVVEARIERVDEAVSRVNVLPVLRFDVFHRRQNNLRREWYRPGERTGGERTVVVGLRAAQAAGGITMKHALLTLVGQVDVRSPVARAKPPP